MTGRFLTPGFKTFSYLIFSENTNEYNVKTSENDVQYSNFDMGEIVKSRELYSSEGDNSSRFEGKQCHGNTLLSKL